MIPVLYDGWPLCYSPNSPRALHVLTLLAARPGEVDPILALPAAPPEWLPEDIAFRVTEVENTPGGRLIWEQSRLPRLARKAGAMFVHTTTRSPALFAPLMTVVSPAGFDSLPEQAFSSRNNHQAGWDQSHREGLSERIRRSLSRGTQDRILGLLWPQDLPYDEKATDPLFVKRLPPVVHPAFLRDQVQRAEILHDLADTYLLYHGPYDRYSVEHLLQAWSWAAGPLGENYPLVLAGVATNIRKPLDNLLETSGFADSVIVLLTLTPEELAALYAGCKGLFHPGPISVWEGPLRYALSCGRAIIATNSVHSEALVGPAAYLVPEGDFRGMGAALITVALEEEVEQRLSLAARERSATWSLNRFREELLETYKGLVNEN